MQVIWELICQYVHTDHQCVHAIEFFIQAALAAPLDEEHLNNPLAVEDFFQGVETLHTGGLKQSQGPLERIYGEITPRGITALLSYLDLDQQDVFYDLGSGFGRMCIQVYLLAPMLHKSVGVELVCYRHEIAVENLQRFHSLQPLVLPANPQSRLLHTKLHQNRDTISSHHHEIGEAVSSWNVFTLPKCVIRKVLDYLDNASLKSCLCVDRSWARYQLPRSLSLSLSCLNSSISISSQYL